MELANRIVLLGASNLTLSRRLVIELVQKRCGAPSDILTAAGHGRSYGHFAQVLIRGLPGISSCGLWPQLASSPPLPTFAFVTDVGNDVPYGYLPDDILKWVRICVERLQEHEARIVMTNLQIAPIESLSERRYAVIRSVFFPFSRLPMRDVVERVAAVHRGLVEMAADMSFELYEPPGDWFGPDLLHILYWKRRTAYAQVVGRLPAQKSAVEAHVARWSRRPRYAHKRVLGLEIRHSQPSGRLTDGSIVSAY